MVVFCQEDFGKYSRTWISFLEIYAIYSTHPCSNWTENEHHDPRPCISDKSTEHKMTPVIAIY